MIQKVLQISSFKNILSNFPKNINFCFAYGSGVFKQKSDPTSNMLDLIFVVRNPYQWHDENMKKNPDHYAQHLRLLGHNTVVKLQELGGAKVFYNTLIKTSEGRNIKYGVILESSLIEDLLDWNALYLAGRLHKPVEIIIEPNENSQLRTALVQNLHSAVHASLILLPENFNEIQFYKTIAGLSYNGDFRMTFGEDKNKIDNIVSPHVNKFKELYLPILKHFDQYMDIPKNSNGDIHQDVSPSAKIYHLSQLPRYPQIKLVKSWTAGSRSQDTEDCLRAIAHNPECGEFLNQRLKEIVYKSSVSQSFKGIFTAGFIKSVKYSGSKILKMIKSKQSEGLISVMDLEEIKKSETVSNSLMKTRIASNSSEKKVQ